MMELFSAAFATLALALGQPSASFQLTEADLNQNNWISAEQGWTCAEPKWAGEPTFSGSILTAVLENDCEMTAPHSDKSMSNLDQFFTENTLKARFVHSGPVSETFLGMPSKYFDVTIREKSGSETITIRQDIHLATDLSNRLIYDVKSTSCEGTGMAEYLKGVATRIEVKAGNTYKVHIRNEVRAEKPWYAPEAVFISKGKETALKIFIPLRAKLMNGMSTHL